VHLFHSQAKRVSGSSFTFTSLLAPHTQKATQERAPNGFAFRNVSLHHPPYPPPISCAMASWPVCSRRCHHLVIEGLWCHCCTAPFMATVNVCQQKLQRPEPGLAAAAPTEGTAQRPGHAWRGIITAQPGNGLTVTQMECAAKHGGG